MKRKEKMQKKFHSSVGPKNFLETFWTFCFFLFQLISSQFLFYNVSGHISPKRRSQDPNRIRIWILSEAIELIFKRLSGSVEFLKVDCSNFSSCWLNWSFISLYLQKLEIYSFKFFLFKWSIITEFSTPNCLFLVFASQEFSHSLITWLCAATLLKIPTWSRVLYSSFSL